LRDTGSERRRTSLCELLQAAKKAWHGVQLNRPDWGENSHSVALGGELKSDGLQFHFILNAYREALEFELPEPPPGGSWRRWIDTGLDSPDDIVPWEAAVPVAETSYRVAAHGVVMLFAH
jgi:glycogen operon protein